MKKLVILVMFSVILLPSLVWGQVASRKRTYVGQVTIGEGWKIILDCVNNDAENGHLVVFRFHLFDNEGKAHTGQYLVSEEDGTFLPRLVPAGNKIFNVMPPSDYRLTSIVRESAGLVTGWIEVIQDNDFIEYVTCSERMQFFVGTVFSTEAGVPASESSPSYVFTVFAAEEAEQKTGIAVSNVTGTSTGARGEEIMITYTLIKPGTSLNGLIRTRIITPGGHLSRFWTELFPEYANDPLWRERRTIAGVIRITAKKVLDGSPVPLVAVVLNTRVTATGFSISPVAASPVK